jgi:hypothetical protein
MDFPFRALVASPQSRKTDLFFGVPFVMSLRGSRPSGGGAQKRIIVGLVERGGKARMFHLNGATASTARDVLTVHSNTIEGVFSLFKRGMVGAYQHCGEAHLHRYLAEFDVH